MKQGLESVIEKYMLVDLENTIICSKNETEPFSNIKVVFKLLCKQGLVVPKKNCKWG